MPVNIVISGSIDMKGVIFDIQRFRRMMVMVSVLRFL